MTSPLENIQKQLERLRRHYQASVGTYNDISLLDLSHTLRIWTELKQPLTKLAPKFSTSIAFKTGKPARRVIKAAHAWEHVFSYLPGGVKTYASNGQLLAFPDKEKNQPFTSAFAVKVTPPLVELNKFCIVAGTAFDQPLIKVLEAETVTRCTYAQWLASEAVRVGFKNKGATPETVSITREMIVKRVANTMDGSHPSLSGGDGTANKFDAPVHRLLEYQWGGLPLPYFILLKIAQDILDVAPRLIPRPA